MVETVTPEVLWKRGLVKGNFDGIKILKTILKSATENNH